jgi:TM2 domain
VAESTEISERTRGVAVPMAILLGLFGAHRFYVGKTGTGLLMLCTMGGCGLWWLYDLILLLAGEFRDGDGRRVVRWSADDDLEPRRLRGEPSEALLGELDALRTEMGDLGERVDFLERLLTRLRERGALPPG